MLIKHIVILYNIVINYYIQVQNLSVDLHPVLSRLVWSNLNMVEHGRTWSNMVEPGRTWSNLVEHGRTWSNLVEHFFWSEVRPVRPGSTMFDLFDLVRPVQPRLTCSTCSTTFNHL